MAPPSCQRSYLLSKHSPAAQRLKAREAAQRAFKDLNSRFAAELETMARSSRYKNWVYNPYRRFAGGVEASFKSNGSPISSLPETQKLNLGLGATRTLGKGLFAIDLVGRGYRVAYSDNKDYTFAKETTSLALSAGAATVVAQGVTLGLTLLLAPAGLTLIVSVGVAAALTAYVVDNIVRDVFDASANALME